MKEKLAKSPLTYVVAVVHISPIIKIKEYIPSLQECIRQDFPELDEISSQAIIVQNKGIQVTPITQWYFSDKPSTTGISLSNTRIMIHTTRYETFDILLKKFKKVLESFNEKLNISFYTKIGLRYINFISVFPEKYIKKELIPYRLPNSKECLAKTEVRQVTQFGLLSFQLSHFSSKNLLKVESNKEIFVPYDLKQNASYLSFEHHEKEKIPEKDYVILDIDCLIEEKEDFVIKKIVEKFHLLHEQIENFYFKHAITEEALKAWK